MRTREFDSNEVLLSALGVFWRKGYGDTSVDDLTRETGVSRSGLYGEFGSKKGLFVAATDLYERRVVDHIIGTLETSDEGLQSIRQAFRTIAGDASSKQRLGCLICNLSSEAAWADTDFGRIVTRFHTRVRAAFLRALMLARDAKEVPRTTDLEAMADFLLGAFQGLAHAIRSPMRPRAVRRYVDHVLRAVALS